MLERLGLPLGVVLGTKGVERHAITFHGQEAHSGSTPMNARRDALAAAAKLALEIRAIAGKHPDAVCTMGSVKTFPGIVTAVVGRCEATLDQRDLDAAVLAAMYREAQRGQPALRARRKLHGGMVAHLEHRAGRLPSRTDRLLRRSDPRDRGRPSHRLPSGPLHDAAEVSRAGIPTVMMFVQSLGGISHNKIEDTREEHLELAVARLRPPRVEGNRAPRLDVLAARHRVEGICFCSATAIFVRARASISGLPEFPALKRYI